MKKSAFILALLLGFSIPVLAEDTEVQPSVNMTPKSTFSGYQNTGARNIYPRINSSRTNYDAARAEFMKPRSVHDIASQSDMTRNKNVPMTYDQFPQNVDSSNMFYNQGLGALQNVQMGF